jgi:hypothetical protein
MRTFIFILEAADTRKRIVYAREFVKEHPQETLFRTLVADGQCSRFLPNGATAADPRIIRIFSRLFVDSYIDYEPDDLSPGLHSDDIAFAHARGLLYMGEDLNGHFF